MYSRQSPYVSKLLSRHRLNGHGSTKETWHVVLSLDGSEISYRPGDSFGILPLNDPETVEALLRSLNFRGSEEVQDERSHELMDVRRWLSSKANLAVGTKKLLTRLQPHHPLLVPGEDDSLTSYFGERSVPEIFAEHPEVALEPQNLCSLLSPLLPRLYSIASSQVAWPGEVHFTVSRVRYEVHSKKRLGVCSHFLCDLVVPSVTHVPIYLQQTKDFLLPENPEVPIIMIGPGTGVAPFRAFMQERLSHQSATDKNWLFFGERHHEHDFFYHDYWQELVSRGKLKLDLAFSRDQEKIYVQHRMWERRRELWHWIQEGAKIYVCGDASRMAKDVDKCLHQIACHEGGFSEESARSFLTELRRHKRYLRDVY